VSFISCNTISNQIDDIIKIPSSAKNRMVLYLLLFINIFYSGTLYAQNYQDEKSKLLQEGNAYFEDSNFTEAARSFNRLAYLYWNEQNLEDATSYYKKALSINERIGNNNAIAVISGNLGMIYADRRQLKLSIQSFQKSLSIKRKNNDNSGIASDLLNIASVYNEFKHYQKSIQYANDALSLATELENMMIMKRAYGLLAENHKGTGNTEKSMEYFDMFASVEKHMQEQRIEQTEQKTKKQIKEMQSITKKAIDEKTQKEKELQEKEDSLKIMEALSRERQMQIELLNKEKQLNEMRLREKETRLKNIALTTYSAIGVTLLLIAIAVILYKGYRQKKYANQKLEDQNKEILRQKEIIDDKNTRLSNNINYAKRIQNTILPKPESLSLFVPDSFIIYKPRDVVSGDFYWFSDTNLKSVITKTTSNILTSKEKNEKKEKPETNEFIISAIDCTGHSVPGALMSMVGYNLLHEIISTGFTQPNIILNALHKGILNELKQEESKNQDGMDIALCVVNRKKKLLSFAGAKNPLVYIRNNQIFRIKGDNMSIGGGVSFDEERRFTNHEVSFEEPTTFYIFSDGYIDQLGGNEGKKFMYSNFKKLLLNIHHYPMDDQATILEERHHEWRKGYSQIDDILIMGFHLS